MARLPRIKVTDEEGSYHICARVAGCLDWFPFEQPGARLLLLEALRLYLQVYCCQLVAFSVMGNHYHLVLRFQRFCRLSRETLYERALLLYPHPERKFRNDREWERFNRRLFDLSEFMRNLQQTVARQYNRQNRRRGAFWAERFKSTLLLGDQAVLDALIYVELNPVRAGLVKQPELWEWSSAALRCQGRDEGLLPLTALMPQSAPGQVDADYRALLYHRGAISTRAGTARIPEALLRQEQARGFARPGVFNQPLRCFSDALCIGPQQQVQQQLDDLYRRGYYAKPRQPVRQPVGDGFIFSLRSQRKRPEWE